MPSFVPPLGRRVHLDEHMDDFSRDESEFERALLELRQVNRFLGGYRTLHSCLAPFLDSKRGATVAILDLGTGLADYPEKMIQWGASRRVDVRVAGIDANPVVVACARRYLDRRLPPELRGSASIREGDATRLPFDDDTFDVVTASLFLHHFNDGACVAILKEMSRVSTRGIVINDLHRHHLAYLGIRAIAAVMPVSQMFANDGPLSVQRAFKPEELRRMAHGAGLNRAKVKRHWPYRLSLSTL